MQVLRKIVNRNEIKFLSIPKEFGDKEELIILPYEQGKTPPAESEAMVRLPEKTGFAVKILAGAQEDVWNDV